MIIVDSNNKMKELFSYCSMDGLLLGNAIRCEKIKDKQSLCGHMPDCRKCLLKIKINLAKDIIPPGIRIPCICSNNLKKIYSFKGYPIMRYGHRYMALFVTPY